MSRPSRIVKRLLLPALLALALIGVQVVVAAPPQPSFDFLPASPVCGQNVAFTSQASDADGDQMTIEWDFEYAGAPESFSADASGDGGISHTYTTPGARTVAQRVTAGLDPAEIATKPLTVGANVPPTAAIAPPPAAQAGQAVHLTGSGSDPTGAITSYAWELDGDNDFNDATTAEVDHVFATIGPKPIALRVTDNCNGTAEATAQVDVGNTAPTQTTFTMSANGTPVDVVNPGTAVAFAGSATDANNDTLTYHWDLDGNNVYDEAAQGETNTATPTKTYPVYPTVKTITVRLRVTDGQGGEGTFQAPLRINKAPFGAFTVSPEAPLIGEAVTFDAGASFDFETNISSYEWDFDYGGTPASFTPSDTLASTSHVFATPGPKAVALRVTDDEGGVTVVARTVTVQLTRPNAGLTFSPDNPLPGEPVTLTSTSTPSATAGAPALEATQWDFDYQPIADFTLDGAGASIVTSFASPGPHTVAVKVTQTGGGFAIATATVVVNAPPQASFTVAPAKPTEGRQVTFASTSSDPDGALAKQEWDLNNDGKFERTGTVVSTSSLKKGTRPVRLRVTDSKGATATSSVPVKVAAKPLRNPQNVVSSVSYQRRSWGIVVVGFNLKTPSKTSVAVTCKGRGCPRGTFRKRTRKKPATLSFPQLAGGLRAGAKINIVFTKPGRITGWDVITVKPGKTALREGCKIGRAKKQKRCP